MRGRRLATGLLAVLSTVCAHAQDRLGVLFLGNSYTYVNDLPGLVADLAASGGFFAETESRAPGGATLRDHFASEASRALVAEGWDVVVLQEQSQLPTIPALRDSLTVPAARGLDSLIAASGARTLFFTTWGREFGGQQCWDAFCSPPFADFFEMQESLVEAYGALAADNRAARAPVGDAWAAALREDPAVDLWTSDHSHPSLEGSYLAACVFHQELFGASAVGLSETAGLAPERARWLQERAAGLLAVGRSDDPSNRPVGFQLSPPWPNPFNPELHLSVELFAPAILSVEIRDLTGRRVDLLASGRYPAGRLPLVWRPQAAASGTYLAVVRGIDGQGVRLVSLLR